MTGMKALQEIITESACFCCFFLNRESKL